VVQTSNIFVLINYALFFIVVIALCLYCIFKSYSSIRLSSRKCV